MEKTVAMKLLDGKHIVYQAVAYDPAMRDAVRIAMAIGVPPGQLFKTLVVPKPEGSNVSLKMMLVMIPGDRQLDLKKLAKAAGVKKAKIATQAEAERLTGLQVGGISALALLNKGFAVYLDASAREHEQIYVSAGQRGINLKLSVGDLVQLTRARLADLSS